jgi:hypothetical protein
MRVSTWSRIVLVLMAGIAPSFSAGLPLLDVWRASDLSALDDGDAVGSWSSASNRVATGAIGLQPTLKLLATPAGGPVVRFTNSLLTTPDSPVGGKTAFSIAYVFRASKAGANDSTLWYGKSGIVDAEAPGVQADWGTVLDQNGQVGLGTGNPDVSTYSTGASLVGSNFHVAVFTWGGGSQSVYVDTRTRVTRSGVSSAARLNGGVALGGILTGENGAVRRFVGDLVEVRFYDKALTAIEATNVITELRETHITPRVSRFSVNPSWIYLGQSALLSWEVTNVFSAVLDPGIGAVPLKGTLEVSPTNTVTYTLTATLNATNPGDVRIRTCTLHVDPGIPLAVNAFTNTPRGAPVALTLQGSDPQGSNVTFAIAMPPQHGSLTGALPELVYSPDAGYDGLDSFAFTVNDGQFTSAPATVTIKMIPPPTPPSRILLSSTNITSGAGPGSFVAVLQAVDVNEGDTHTFSLVPGFGDNSKFSIDNNALLAGPQFAGGPGSRFLIRLEAMDSAGLTCQQEMTLVVVDRLPQVVINEIHYNGPDNTVREEFIELYNPGDAPVDLSQWRLRGGVTYAFPINTLVPGHGFVVVAEDPQTVQARFGATAFGPWSGALNNDGETATLSDALDHVIDEVAFTTEFPWPIAANGAGASMQLVNPDLDNDLGSSWRSGTPPTPGATNVVFAANAAPNIRQVKHTPKSPTATNQVTITCKVTDPEGVASVSLRYQLVAPGQFLPATLPLTVAQLNNYNSVPLTNSPNPAFEAATNWITIAMHDDGLNGDEAAGDNIYSIVLPPQPNRTLVRYRTTVADTLGAARRAPFEDDPSLNFAYFVYNGVPDYGKVPAAAMQSLPVYFLLTRKTDFDTCNAYNGGDQLPQFTGSVANEGRFVFNWSGAFVYDGEVYDHVHYRTQGANGRYQPARRSYRIEFNDGRMIEAKDNAGQPYPTKWKVLNIAKGQSNRQTVTFSLNEVLNYFLWNKVGVPAPFTHYMHWRVIRGAQEQPDLYSGDFYGTYMVQENYDVRFLEAHHLPKGNLYKLINAARSLNVYQDMQKQQRYQGPSAVTNGADAVNAQYKLTTDSGQPVIHDTPSLLAFVNYPEWYRYHTICEVVRDYDFWPDANKNAAWYFEPSYGGSNNFFGRLWTLPWDATDTWGPTWNGGEDMCFNGIFPSGYGGGDSGQNPELQVQYFNTFREIRDLLIQPDQVNPVIDAFARRLAAINPADLACWSNNPVGGGGFRTLGVPGPGLTGGILAYAQDMKNFLFTGGTYNWWIDRNTISAGGWAVMRLDSRMADAAIPTRPVVTYAGGTNGFPLDNLIFRSSAFADPQGSNTFAAVQWRVAEVTPANPPVADPGQMKFEWDAVWDSGELAAFVEYITVPPTVVQPDHLYRVRVRHKDTTGRWSRWSAPLPFRPQAVDVAASLRGHLVFSEIMYNPPGQGGADGDEFEFVELKNIGRATLDLSGLYFSSGITFTFTNGIQLAPGGLLLLARNPQALQSRYPGVVVNGVYTGKLNNDGEELAISHPHAGVILSVTYQDRAPWPAAGDGFGFSLVLADPATGAYRASAARLGSPGTDESPGQIGGVVISEVLSSSTLPLVDTIELQNFDYVSEVDISGWYLTDDPTYPWKYRFPAGTILGPGAFLTVNETQFDPTPGVGLSFALSSFGDDVYLFSADASGLTGYSHGFHFGGAPDGVSLGRHLNSVGEEQFVLQKNLTFGATNSGPRVGPVVINEIQYHPPAGEAEFVELKNITASPVALFDPAFPTNGWKVGGLGYVFPTNTSISGNGYLVLVSGDPDVFRARYQVPVEVGVLQFTGGLQDNGEQLELLAPDRPATNGAPYFAIDTVRYDDRAPWPEAADGAGASLQRFTADAYGNDLANWIAAVPTPGGEPAFGLLPIITQPPSSQTNALRQTVTLSASAVGSPPLSYQWRLNGGNVPGATNATLVLANLQLTDAGTYSVSVFNAVGSTVSTPATLTVLMPVMITQPPAGVSVRPGTNVTFTVGALSSRPVSYQWRRNGVDIPEATATSYTVSKVSAQDDALYQVLVADWLSSELSQPVRLMVLVDPTFASGPRSQIVPIGSNIDLSVQVGPTTTVPVFYRLRRNTSNFGDFTLDQRTMTYTLTNAVLTNSAAYYFSVTNQAKSTFIYSPTSYVAVVVPPANVTVAPGADAAFTVVVGVPGSTTRPAPMDFQWQYNGVPLSNAPSLSAAWSTSTVTITNTGVLITTNSLRLSGVQPGDSGAYGLQVSILTNVPVAPALFSATLQVGSPDRDGDGLPDDWELAHGLNPDDPRDAPTDADGDGMSNLAEYQAGTDPQDPRSYLKVELVTGPGQGTTNVLLRFGAVANKTYSVLYQNPLTSGREWHFIWDGRVQNTLYTNPSTNADTWLVLTNLSSAPSNRTVTVSDQNPTAPERYYQVRTPQQP